MADALLAPTVAATMYVLSGTTVGVSLKNIEKEEDSKILPVMAVSSALVFAGQMINYTIPGTGSSGHICGGVLLSTLLGPYAGFLSMVVILAIQCLLFADGGLMALGANCWNMGFYGCFVGYFLIMRPILKSSLFEKKFGESAMRAKIILASVVACILTLQLGAFSVVLETTMSGITELPFGVFAGLMQPIHLAIGLVEGIATAAILTFVHEARPELLNVVKDEKAKSRLSYGKTIAVIAIIAALTGGIFSLFASENPDGLEWTLFGNQEAGYAQNMGLDEEDYGVQSSVAEALGSVQETTSFLPDYTFKDAEGSAETIGVSVSGILGSAFVAALAYLVCMGARAVKRKKV